RNRRMTRMLQTYDIPPCRCQPMHRGVPVDTVSLNFGWSGITEEHLRYDPPAATGGVPFVIVPGYCPHFGWRRGLHPRAVRRLERALARAGASAATFIVSGGAVHSDENEAVLMREWLLARGVSARRILVEPCARHTTTNLRNAGRMVLAAGASE